MGFHPWHGVDHLTDEDFALLERCACHSQVLAIGETGMDRLRGAALEVQSQVFIRHLRLACRLGKPVVAHCVRTAQDILAARRAAHLDDVTLIIHGMRGNANVARVLLEAGCYLSFGMRYNPASLFATLLDRLLIETDEIPFSIDDVAHQVAATLAISPQSVITHAAANASRLLGLKTS